MVFKQDLPPEHPDYQLRGQPKGMLHILEERGLVSVLEQANQGKVVGECQMCKLSREAQERMHREAQAVAEGGEEPVGEIATNAVLDLRRTDCCMRKLLASQQDFKEEKPLIQIIIERAGHKCWFLPKFHCELNPIEMYWGWAKAREFGQWECYLTKITDGRCITTITGFQLVADGTFPTARRLVPEILDDCPIKTICGFF